MITTVLYFCLVFYVAQCEVIDLGKAGHWTLFGGDKDSISVPGHVPGNVYTDLQQAGTLSSGLYYRFNDVEYRWVSYSNWTYQLEFTLTKEQIQRSSVKIDCHGLDTVASVYLNNVLAGTSDNMFTR